MKNKAYDIRSYQFQKDEEILIDANIWLYLFPAPTGKGYQFASSYSHAFKSLTLAGAKPVIDTTIMSEYLNRYCRLEWQAGFIQHYQNYKDFRQSVDFKTIAKNAVKFANTIATMCEINNITIDETGLKKLLSDFESATADFNDLLLIHLCKNNHLKLMTNDGDFQLGGIEILTSNPKLLSKKQI